MSESGMQHAATSCVSEVRPWMRLGYVWLYFCEC